VAKRVVIAVIGEKKDDGVFEEAIGFETIHDVSDMAVRDADGVVMVSPFLAEDFLVWEVRWDLSWSRGRLCRRAFGCWFFRRLIGSVQTKGFPFGRVVQSAFPLFP
jgi:hypothetical protein